MNSVWSPTHTPWSLPHLGPHNQAFMRASRLVGKIKYGKENTVKWEISVKHLKGQVLKLNQVLTVGSFFVLTYIEVTVEDIHSRMENWENRSVNLRSWQVLVQTVDSFNLWLLRFEMFPVGADDPPTWWTEISLWPNQSLQWTHSPQLPPGRAYRGFQTGLSAWQKRLLWTDATTRPFRAPQNK